MDDAFDPNALLDTEYSGNFNRYLTAVPAGEHYCRVKDNSVKVRSFISKAGNKVTMCDMAWVVEDPNVAEQMKVKEALIFDSFFLDTDPNNPNRLITKEENPNANLTLGRLKYAMNVKEGVPWSLRRFEGMACYLRVEQETNPQDVEDVRNKITGYYRERRQEEARGGGSKRR